MFISIIILYFSSYSGKADEVVADISSDEVYHFVIPNKPLKSLDLHFKFHQEPPLPTMQPTIGITSPPITTYHPMLDQRILNDPDEDYKETRQPTIGIASPPITTYHPMLDQRILNDPDEDYEESSAKNHSSSFIKPRYEQEMNQTQPVSTTSNFDNLDNDTIEYPSTSIEPTLTNEQDNETSGHHFYIYPGFHTTIDSIDNLPKPTDHPVEDIQGDLGIDNHSSSTEPPVEDIQGDLGIDNHSSSTEPPVEDIQGDLDIDIHSSSTEHPVEDIQGDLGIDNHSSSTEPEPTLDDQLVNNFPTGLLKLPQENEAILNYPRTTSITNTTTISPLSEEDPDCWLTEEPENIALPEFHHANINADANFIGYEIPCGIGKISNTDDERIVNGSDALIGEFPWMVSIQLKSGLSWRHICGGVVISRYHIITAGHCIYQLPLHSLSVVAGAHSLYIHEGHEQRRGVVRAQAKKGFVHDNFQEDIAILQLEPYLKLDGTWVAPICLPSPTQQLPSVSRAIVAGWGRLSEGGSLPQILQKVSLPIISKERCRTLYEQNGFVSYMHSCQICSGWEEGGSDSCQGDSGGPLACQDEDDRYFLCGVVSWGIGCARPKYPGVYTQVSCYSQWISDVLYKKPSVVYQTIDIAS